MDSFIIRYLERILLFYQGVLLKMQSQLSRMTDPRLETFTLSYRVLKDGRLSYRLKEKQGTTAQRSITANGALDALRKKLQMHYYFRKAIGIVSDNIRSIEHCMKKIQAIQPDLLEKGFPRSYHNWVERKETALKDSKAYWRLTHYLEDGFYPCDTLIMTYESDQKRLTPEEIELAIDRYLYSWKYEKVI